MAQFVQRQREEKNGHARPSCPNLLLASRDRCTSRARRHRPLPIPRYVIRPQSSLGVSWLTLDRILTRRAERGIVYRIRYYVPNVFSLPDYLLLSIAENDDNDAGDYAATEERCATVSPGSVRYITLACYLGFKRQNSARKYAGVRNQGLPHPALFSSKPLRPDQPSS